MFLTLYKSGHCAEPNGMLLATCDCRHPLPVDMPAGRNKIRFYKAFNRWTRGGEGSEMVIAGIARGVIISDAPTVMI